MTVTIELVVELRLQVVKQVLAERGGGQCVSIACRQRSREFAKPRIGERWAKGRRANNRLDLLGVLHVLRLTGIASSVLHASSGLSRMFRLNCSEETIFPRSSDEVCMSSYAVCAS